MGEGHGKQLYPSLVNHAVGVNNSHVRAVRRRGQESPSGDLPTFQVAMTIILANDITSGQLVI